MLRFSDFSHLPEADKALAEVLGSTEGLLLVAGPDGRPAPDVNPAHHFLPSGRNTIFRILVSEWLDAHPDTTAWVVAADRDVLHVARRFRRRLDLVQVGPNLTYAQALSSIPPDGKTLVVIDQLTEDSANVALTAARQSPVITQLDTVHHGAGVVEHLRDLGAETRQLDALRWIVTVQRLPLLCPICRQPAAVTLEQLEQLRALDERYGEWASHHFPPDGGSYATAPGCPRCAFTGRQGDIALFDFFEAAAPAAELAQWPSRLSLESYIWMLARRGQLALTDCLNFEREQMRRVYNLLSSSERRAADAGRDLDRKIAELETANRVLTQRTRELISLESLGQALLSSFNLASLGSRVLLSAMELCHADRAVLYYVRSADWAEVLAARGWTNGAVGTGLARSVVYDHASDKELRPYMCLPPGLNAPADLAPATCGLAIPLIADGLPAGLMIVQSTRKSRFTPGEVTLLETLAGHAAVAMQRANLIEQLQSKIAALESAQAELAQKERLEREMELAREVQLSMLPKTFPAVPGLAFAAQYAPAREVGGDFYDVMALPDGRVAVVIADVSDKGMAAALYVTLVRSLILAAAAQNMTPAQVLRQVNQLLVEYGRQDMFVTVFYGIIDPREGSLTYCRAGHDYPWLVSGGNFRELTGDGIALGLFGNDEIYLAEERVPLKPGDRLVLYTDGLTDVMNSAGAMIGKARLRELVQKALAAPLDDMGAGLFADLARYRGGAAQFDDMALLTIALT